MMTAAALGALGFARPGRTATAGSVGLDMLGLNVTVSSTNASSAARLEGDFFRLRDSGLWQLGGCRDPHATPGGYYASMALWVEGSRDGLISGSTIGWKCSAYDIDASERIVFEENRIRCLDGGAIPGGRRRRLHMQLVACSV